MRKFILRMMIGLAMLGVFGMRTQAEETKVPTEQDAYQAMIAFKDTYPEGTQWPESNAYKRKSEKGYTYTLKGSMAFAYTLSDAAFGSLPERSLTNVDISMLHVGDIVYSKYYEQYAVVLEMRTDHIIVGGVFSKGDTVTWEIAMPSGGIPNLEEVITRYPEGTFDDSPRRVIRFDANGGKNAPYMQIMDAGEAVKLTTNTPTKVDGEFMGWTKDPEGTAVMYKAGDSYVGTEDVTLYAVWKEVTYPDIPNTFPSETTVYVDADNTFQYLRFIPEESGIYTFETECYNQMGINIYDAAGNLLRSGTKQQDDTNGYIVMQLERGVKYFVRVGYGKNAYSKKVIIKTYKGYDKYAEYEIENDIFPNAFDVPAGNLDTKELLFMPLVTGNYKFRVEGLILEYNHSFSMIIYDNYSSSNLSYDRVNNTEGSKYNRDYVEVKAHMEAGKLYRIHVAGINKSDHQLIVSKYGEGDSYFRVDGSSLSIMEDGMIRLNLQATIIAGDTDYKCSAKIKDNGAYTSQKSVTAAANTSQVITCSYAMEAARMTDDITVEYYDSKGSKIKAYTQSVSKYARTLINSGTLSANDKAVLEALLSYGACAQKYFDYRTEKLASTKTPWKSCKEIPSDQSKVSIGSLSGIQYVGSSLILKDGLTIRHYFVLKGTAKIESFTFTRGSKTLTPVEKQGVYYVDITSIPFTNMGTNYALKISDGSSTGQINYHINDYLAKAYAAAENADEDSALTEENFVNLVKSLNWLGQKIEAAKQ